METDPWQEPWWVMVTISYSDAPSPVMLATELHSTPWPCPAYPETFSLISANFSRDKGCPEDQFLAGPPSPVPLTHTHTVQSLGGKWHQGHTWVSRELGWCELTLRDPGRVCRDREPVVTARLWPGEATGAPRASAKAGQRVAL